MKLPGQEYISREIVFIDSNIADWSTLAPSLRTNAQVIKLDGRGDGLQQMAAYLSRHGRVDAIHLVSHGQEGQIQLGTLTLNTGNMDAHRGELATIGRALTEHGSLLLYGCNVARGEGSAFIRRLADLTEKNIAASDDLTGPGALGGNWRLEARTGSINTAEIFDPAKAESYRHLLTSTTYTVTNNNASGTGSFLAAFTSANVAAHTDTIVFDSAAFDPATVSAASRTITLGANLATIVATSITINGDVNGDNIPDVILNGGGKTGFNATGSSIALSLSSLDLTNFLASSSATANVVRMTGSNSAVTITDCLVHGNGGTGNNGGAVQTGGTGTTLSVDRSVFYSNVAALNGGAIYAAGAGASSITNSVFYNNQANGTGSTNGGGAIKYSSTSASTLSIYNVTVVGNTASSGSGTGGGIQGSTTSTATMVITDSLVVDNTGSGSADDIADVGSSSNVTSTNVTTGSGSGLFVSEGSGTNRDLRLASSSAAINAGSASSASPNATYDLLGNPRQVGSNVDRGAYEYAAARTFTLDADNSAGASGNNYRASGNATQNVQIGIADSDATIGSSTGDTNVRSVTMTLSGVLDTGSESLALTGSNPNINALLYNTTSNTLTLYSKTTATLADMQSAIQAVVYKNSAATPTAGVRTVSVTISDASDSSTATATLTLSAAASAPTATSGSATSITATGATLNGTVNDNGATTTVTFDYGTTTGYGTNTAATTGGTITAGTGSTAASVAITGLTCNTTYHFRVNGNNGSGTTNGSDASFTTSQCPQTITFSNPGAKNFGTTPTLTATSTSSLTVAFTSATTSVCTITSSGVLAFVSAGTCTINADQAGDSTYAAAPQVQQSFTVNAVAPGAPTIGTATAGNTQASVTFTAPASSGGASVTSYTATSNPGNFTGSGSTSPITVTGLSNGTAYTFTVTATNSATLTGSASAASNSVTPVANQTITFSNPGSKNFGTTPTLTATSTSSLTVAFTSATTGVCTITSGGVLAFVSAGTCTINADQAGDSTYAAAPQVQQSFTINAIAPGAPTIGTATAGNTQASVNFTAPTFTGGASLTGYTVTVSPGNATVNGNASPITVTGLSNGTAYTFTVTATNSVPLTGSASAASNSVTPASGPAVASVAVPANGRYKAGSNLDFTITWDQNVTVTGTPQLALVIGSSTVQANYVSSPTATTTLFRYTVLAGQTDTDGITVGSLALNGGTIQSGSNVDATLTLNSVASTTAVLVDTTAPTLPAANIVVNNQSDPHQVVLTFSESLASANIGAGGAWTVTGNGGTPSYPIANVALTSSNQITLTLAAVDLSGTTSNITNIAANAHLKITPPATLTDLAGNSYAAGLVTEAGATHVLDNTLPTLSAVSSSGASSTGGTLNATASEKARGYWIAVASGAAAPSVAQVKAAVNYGSPLVTIAASGNGVLPGASAGTLSLTGLLASTTYDLYLIAEDAAGNLSATASTTALTTSASAPQPPITTPVVTPTGNTSGFVVSVPSNVPQIRVSDPGTVIQGVPTGTKLSDNGVVVLPEPVAATPAAPVVIAAATPANAVIQLPASGPTTFNVGGQTFTLTPAPGSSANTPPVQVETKTVTVTDSNGTSRSVTGLQVIQGSAVLTGTTGQVLSAFGAASNADCGQAPGFIIPLSNDTAVSASATDQSWLLLGHLDSGSAIFHFNVCTAAANTFAASGGQDVVVYRGEQAFVDKGAQVARIVVRSASGTVGDAGDRLTLTGLPGFTFNPTTFVPLLSKDTGRLPTGSTLQSLLGAVPVNTAGAAATVLRNQDSLGALRYTRGNLETVVVLPVGEVIVQPGRANSVVIADSGQAQVTVSETVITFNALPRDASRLVSDLQALNASAALKVVEDGSLRLSLGTGQLFAVQPAWSALYDASYLAAPAFSNDTGNVGVCHNADGWQQCYYPVANDFVTLQALARQVDAAAKVVADRQGHITVTLQSRDYVLTPDWQIITTPASHANDSYWSENGKLFVRNPNGLSQGFAVR